MKKTWSVLVVHEDQIGREQAMRFCDSLVDRFWSQCDFDVEWRSLRELAGSVQRAALADLIVVAMNPEGELPFELAEWSEGWVRERGEREGKLVGLLNPVDEISTQNTRHEYLRAVAHRAGMDYLTQVPCALDTISDSLESYSERAGQVSSVLDEILHRQKLPTAVQ